MQNGVTLSTKESDLNIKYGPLRYGTLDSKPSELAFTSVKYILTDYNSIRENYIRLGFHLSQFKRFEYYHDFGYSSMEDFCAANLGLDKSSISRCINVYREFNASNISVYDRGIKSIGSHMDLADEWKEFSYSQLCEMVSMDDMQRKQVTPDMTIKQIRELKKGNVSQDVSQVATSQPEKEKYCISKYCNLKGIVRQNYIKNLAGERYILEIFDNNGKKVFHGPCYKFNEDANFLMLRLEDDQSIGNA